MTDTSMPVTVILIAGAIVLAVGILGCITVIFSFRLLLMAFAGALILIICIQLGIAISGIKTMQGNFLGDLERNLTGVFRNLTDTKKSNETTVPTNRYFENTGLNVLRGSETTIALDSLQKAFSCCGVTGPEDYENPPNMIPVPKSCGNNTVGCPEAIVVIIHSTLNPLLFTLLVLCAVDVIAVSCAIVMLCTDK